MLSSDLGHPGASFVQKPGIRCVPQSLSQFDSSRNSVRAVRARAGGFTLIELLLVVAIIIVVTATTVPAVQRVFARQALQKGADRLRVAMGQARVRAIRNGEEYAVFLTPGGSWFNVDAFYNFNEQKTRAQQAQQFITTGNFTDYEENILPRGVTFVDGETQQDARAAAVSGGSQGTVGDGIQAILFYPDGTSQDARIVLQNDKQNMLQVELRGLTGIAKTTRIAGNNQ